MTEVKKRWEFVEGDTVRVNGHVLTRIRALVDMPHHGVKAGGLGGYVEKEENLPQGENGWVVGDAKVFGDARVFGNARVGESAWVFGNAWVGDYAWVFGYALVGGDARVGGYARLDGHSRIKVGAIE